MSEPATSENPGPEAHELMVSAQEGEFALLVQQMTKLKRGGSEHNHVEDDQLAVHHCGVHHNQTLVSNTNSGIECVPASDGSCINLRH